MASSRQLFLDTDFFVLMAGANLIAPLLDALDFSIADARRLDPVPHMLERGSLARKYAPGIREKAAAWCEEISPIRSRPAPDLHQPLHEALDVGEALLFATVIEAEGRIMATGDIRACQTIATDESLAQIRPRLKEKVICLESSLTLLVEEVGFESLASALSRVREYNKTIRVLLSRAEATPEREFRQGLESYLGDVKKKTGELLYKVPPAG